MTDQQASKVIYRVAGIPAAATPAEICAVLLNKRHCTTQELQNTQVLELDLIPSCYNTETQAAFVRFSQNLGFMARGEQQWQIQVDGYKLTIDRHFKGFTQLYSTPVDQKIEVE